MENRPVPLLVLVLLFAGCSTPPAEQPGPAAQPAPVTTTLTIPGAVSTGANAAARGDQVIVTWTATAAERTDVYAAASLDGGRTFAVPVRVNDVVGDARFTSEQPARVAIGTDIAVVWQSRRSDVARVRIARSADGGRTFLPAATIHEENLTGARGWASLTLDKAGAHVAWLDARTAGADHAEHTGGAHALHAAMRQNIFHALITPDGARAETRVATDVCFCCKTSVATGPSGETYVAWRHIYPTNLRDMAVARSNDGGRTFGAPVRVSEDGWQIDGCPEDGPSMGVDASGAVHIAWPTLIQGTDTRKAVFYSVSTDGGRTFAPRMRIDDETAGLAAHPQLAVADRRVFIVWDERHDGDSRVQLREVGATVSPGPVTTIAPGGPNAYPAVATTTGAVVIAWVSNGQVQTRRIPRP